MSSFSPYTYYLRWTTANLHYYGCEYGSKSKTANPNNLWTTYFTSSANVALTIEKYGQPDLVKVHKVFSDPQEARYLEERMLCFFDAGRNSSWVNGSNGGKNFCPVGLPGPKNGMYGKSFSHTQEAKEKISFSKRGEKHYLYGKELPDETKDAISRKLTGRKFSQEHRKKISASNSGANHWIFGKTHSAETIAKMKEVKVGKRWFNNGKIERCFRESEVPPNFLPGRLRRK